MGIFHQIWPEKEDILNSVNDEDIERNTEDIYHS